MPATPMAINAVPIVLRNRAPTNTLMPVALCSRSSGEHFLHELRDGSRKHAEAERVDTFVDRDAYDLPGLRRKPV